MCNTFSRICVLPRYQSLQDMKFVWTQNRSKSGTRYFSEIVFHFLRFSGTAGKQRIPLCTPHDSDLSTSSDCSSVPLWPEGSTLFFLRDYLYSLSCWWVSVEERPSREKETCRVTLWRASCLLPKLWTGPPPDSPPTEAWQTDIWGSSNYWAALGETSTFH